MRKVLFLVALTAVIIISNDSSALAASGGDVAWNKPVEGLAGNLQNKVVPYVLDIMIAISGMLILFGEQNRFRPVLNIVLGCSLAAQAGLVLSTLGFDEMLHPSYTTGASIPIKQIKITNDLGNFDLLSGFMNNFIQVVKAGARNLMGYALKLAGLLVIIDWSISLSLGLVKEDKIRFLVMQMLKIGFFVFLIKNWVDGTAGLSEGITHMIVASFEKLGFIASTSSIDYMPDSIVANGFKTFEAMWKGIKGLGMGSISVILADLILAAAILGSMILAGIEMFMARIEFWTVALVTLPLLPFGMNKHTSFLAEKAIGAIFSLGVKVCVISFLSAVCSPLLFSFASQIVAASEASNKPLEFNLLLQMLVASLIVFVLIHRIPSLVQGLINGSPSLASGDFREGFRTMAAPVTAGVVAANAAGSAYGTYQMASSMEGGGTAMETDGSLRRYDTSWLGGVRAKMAQGFGTAKNIGRVELQKYNPFTVGYNDSMSSAQNLMNQRAGNEYIVRMAHGTEVDSLNVASRTDGAIDNQGQRIMRGGKPTTHGWTPVNRGDNVIDQDTNEKVNALYLQYHKK